MATGTPAHEFRALNAEELTERLFQAATGQLTNNNRLRTVKRDIARIYTVIRERELGLSVVPGDEEAEG